MGELMKPVWRMNTGSGVPGDYSFLNLLFQEGELYSDWDRTRQMHEPEDWVIKDGHNNIIAYAYQTKRTKPAKYEKVECGNCINGWAMTGIDSIEPCSECKGTGHIWKPIN